MWRLQVNVLCVCVFYYRVVLGHDTCRLVLGVLLNYGSSGVVWTTDNHSEIRGVYADVECFEPF